MEVVRYLVKNSTCDVNIKDNVGDTPLDLARRYVKCSVLITIIMHSAIWFCFVLGIGRC